MNITSQYLLDAFIKARSCVAQKKPLIHSIMGHIAINDCANAVLALGASPIMAEHPSEVSEITNVSAALTVSLANITNERLTAIMASGETAHKNDIPSVIDVVGVTCSSLRMEAARQYIDRFKPDVIKGNISEIKAIAGAAYQAAGVDVSENDVVIADNTSGLENAAQIIKAYAKKTSAVVMASGAVDIISDGKNVVYVENGSMEMSRVTGTGCMLNVITGVYLSCAAPLDAAVLAAVTLGISGELADKTQGLGSYHTDILNQLSKLSDDAICKYAKIRVS